MSGAHPWPPAPGTALSPPHPQARANAPGATLSLVLGIVSLVGVVLVVPVFLAPLAGYHAVAARRRIAREPGRWSGAGRAQAGLVLAMIASGMMLLLLALLVLAGVGTFLITRYDSGYSV